MTKNVYPAQTLYKIIEQNRKNKEMYSCVGVVKHTCGIECFSKYSSTWLGEVGRGMVNIELANNSVGTHTRTLLHTHHPIPPLLADPCPTCSRARAKFLFCSVLFCSVHWPPVSGRVHGASGQLAILRKVRCLFCLDDGTSLAKCLFES